MAKWQSAWEGLASGLIGQAGGDAGQEEQHGVVHRQVAEFVEEGLADVKAQGADGEGRLGSGPAGQALVAGHAPRGPPPKGQNGQHEPQAHQSAFGQQAEEGVVVHLVAGGFEVEAGGAVCQVGQLGFEKLIEADAQQGVVENIFQGV